MNFVTDPAGKPRFSSADAAMLPHKVHARVPVRVFLVEDSPMTRDRLQEGLTLPGRIEVIGHADTAAAALFFLSQHDCEAIVLDLDLKQGNGLQVLAGLRSRFTGTHPLVVIFTNYVLPQYRNQSMQLGADYFFDKVRDFDRVREVIESIAFAPDTGAPPAS